jgi:hypothetical protein
MSNCVQAFEPLAEDVVSVAPKIEHGETLLSPELREALEELDRHLQTFLWEHNSAERVRLESAAGAPDPAPHTPIARDGAVCSELST